MQYRIVRFQEQRGLGCIAGALKVAAGLIHARQINAIVSRQGI
jgi:hypothetical protein